MLTRMRSGTPTTGKKGLRCPGSAVEFHGPSSHEMLSARYECLAPQLIGALHLAIRGQVALGLGNKAVGRPGDVVIQNERSLGPEAHGEQLGVRFEQTTVRCGSAKDRGPDQEPVEARRDLH